MVQSASLRTVLAIVVCFFVASVEGFDLQAFGVAAPSLVKALMLTPSQQGMAASAAMVGLAIGAFVGGWLADRVGRKPVLTVAVTAFGICSLWTATVSAYEPLLAARVLAGVGFGAAMPNLIAIASEISSQAKRGLITSVMFCGIPFGGACVALAASLGGSAMDWRTIFVVGGILPLAIVPAILWLLPETLVRHSGKRAPILSLLFGEGRAVRTLLLWSVNLLTLIVVYLLLNWLPSLVVAKGFAVTDGANAAMAFNVAGVIGAVLIGLSVDRFGYGRAFMAAYIALALSVLGLGYSQTLSPLVIAAGTAGFLVLGVQYALYGFSPLLYPSSAKAAGAGAAVAVGRFGSIIGPIVAGELRAAGWSASQVLLAMLPVVIVAGIAAVILVANRGTSATDLKSV